MRFVIDTNILVDQLRGGNEWSKFSAFLTRDSEIYVPTIVAFELYAGTSSRKRAVVEKIEAVKFFLKTIDMTWDIAKRAGQIYRERTIELDPADCIIASTAIELGAHVVTLNKKHFRQIKGVYLFETV